MIRELREASAPLEVPPKSLPMSSIRRLPGWTCLACALIMENYLTMRKYRMMLVLKKRPQKSILLLKQALNPSLTLLRWCQAPLSPTSEREEHLKSQLREPPSRTELWLSHPNRRCKTPPSLTLPPLYLCPATSRSQTPPPPPSPSVQPSSRLRRPP